MKVDVWIAWYLCVKCNNRKYTKIFLTKEAENCMFKGIQCAYSADLQSYAVKIL